MAAGYSGRDLRGSFNYGVGSAVQFPYPQPSNGGSSNLLKRSLTEFEQQQQQQQQVQNALYLRSVKQRTLHLNSPIDLSSSSSILSSSAVNFLAPQRQSSTISTPLDKKSAIKDQLQELERQLFLDDDDDDDVSITGSSTVTTTDWGEAMQQLISPSPLPSPPLTSSSSSSSSSSSCSPAPSTSTKQLLLETAAAISELNLEAAASNLAVLKRSANPRGDPDQRLTAMMVPVLVSRINPPPATAMVTSPIADLCSLEHHTATQILYDVSPCFKLGLLAANFAILDATRDQSKIHIIDFGLGQGLQYASLINSIAERSYHRPIVKITAVCEPTLLFNTINTVNNLKVIGDKIVRLAERFNVQVQFNVLNKRTKEIDRAVLGCDPSESLAVNFAFVVSRIADESVTPANPRDELLRQVKSLEPNIVTIVEQEMNANTAPFLTRFNEACSYYGSILESLDATSNRENMDRARVESSLARKALNNLAREGAERVERSEVFGKWRARMSMAGFQPVAFGPGIVEQVKSRFGSMKSNPGFTYKEESGGVGFGWMGRVLTVASSWC